MQINKYNNGLILTSLFLLLSACSGCPDDTTENFLLTEKEKQLIGFNTKQVVFVDEINREFTAEYDPKQNLITDTQASDDETCFSKNIESVFIFLNFTDGFEEFNISLRKNTLNETSFVIHNGNETLSLNDCDGFITNIPETKSISVNGFQFTNVLDFNNCLGSGKAVRILYSPDIGIKYIEFGDKTFLRLKE